MTILKYNDLAVRNDNGRLVRIIQVRPLGFSVFYVTEDRLDGHTTVLDHKQLRPAPKERQS